MRKSSSLTSFWFTCIRHGFWRKAVRSLCFRSKHSLLTSEDSSLSQCQNRSGFRLGRHAIRASSASLSTEFSARQLLKIAAALWLFLLCNANCSACLRPDGTDDSQYVTAGIEWDKRVLWFKVLVPGVGVGFRYGSCAYLNSEYAITAAHTVTDLLQFNPTYQVGTGSSYSNNLGVVASATVTVYPAFNPNDLGHTIDLAIIHFAQPIDGPRVTITNAQMGALLTHAGFGDFGSPSAGETPRDGNRRAFLAVRGEFPQGPNIPYGSTYFCSTDFSPYFAGNGKGLSGDSGGGVFDASTNLVGIMEAQVGFDAPSGETLYLDLTQPDVYSWIVSNTQVTSIRPVLSLANAGMIFASGPTNGIYCFEASTNLVDWSEIGRLPASSNFVSFRDNESTNFSFRYYRVRVQ
jgi:hypothetical protein